VNTLSVSSMIIHDYPLLSIIIDIIYIYVVGMHIRDIPRCLRPSNIRPSSALQRLGWNAGRNSTWHPAQVVSQDAGFVMGRRI